MDKTNGYIVFLTRVSAFSFVVMALLGAWLAPQPLNALYRFLLLSFGVLSIFAIGKFTKRKGRSHTLGGVGFICGICAGAIGTYSLVASSSLTRLLPMQADQIAATLIILIPLGISGVYWAATRTLKSEAALGSVFVSIAFLALVLNTSRTAVTGLLIGVVCAYCLYWRCTSGRNLVRSRIGDILLGSAFLAIVLIFWTILSYAIMGSLLSNWDIDGSINSHLALWQDSAESIGNFIFTRSGLHNTGMSFSSHIFVLPIPFVQYDHNLYLQIAVDQGVLSLLAFLTLCVASTMSAVTSIRQSRPSIQFHAATSIAALWGILVYGLVDAELYSSVWVPILFIPIGIGIALKPLPNILKSKRENDEKSTNDMTQSITLVRSSGWATRLFMLLAVVASIMPKIQAQT